MKKISLLVVLLLGLWGCDNSSNKGKEANGSYDSSMTPARGVYKFPVVKKGDMRYICKNNKY